MSIIKLSEPWRSAVKYIVNDSIDRRLGLPSMGDSIHNMLGGVYIAAYMSSGRPSQSDIIVRYRWMVRRALQKKAHSISTSCDE